MATLPEEEGTAGFVLLQMGTQKPGNLGLDPERGSASTPAAASLPATARIAMEVQGWQGGPGAGTLPSPPDHGPDPPTALAPHASHSAVQTSSLYTLLSAVSPSARGQCSHGSRAAPRTAAERAVSQDMDLPALELRV